ncbi:TetR/AcrR family transcriptional regulator [Nocardia rhizosphaerae]|uniref:TetR/AcrR family transcriptional regulator n=1 Tax=Nocardia rhizosphaerae TaxID=1691571 RepID=A0ABV8L6L6_9NOCA
MPEPDQSKTRIPLTRARVLDAGVALADADGIAAVTMRKLGSTLGVEAMALYNHIANKDDLLDGMLDHIADEIEFPTSEPGPNWRLHTRRRAVSAHTVLLRHPWAAAMWTARLDLGPARMRYMDRALRSLREAGFTGDLLDRTYHAIENHIVGHAMQALGLPLDPTDLAELGARYLRGFPTEQYPDLAAHIRHHLDHPGGGDEFSFALDLLLDGLERLRDGR